MRMKRIRLTPFDVIKPMIALLTLNIIVLSVWTAVSPLQCDTIIVARDIFERVIETRHICRSGHSEVFISVLFVINMVSLVIALVQAYQARNISVELSESTYIFRVMSTFLYLSFLGMPILVIARDNVDAYYFVRVGLVSVICSSILLFIFVPKILARKKKSVTSTSQIPKRWSKDIAKKDIEEEKEEEADAINSAGSVMVTVAVSSQLLLSVTVTVNVPAVRPVTVAVVAPVFHT